MSVSPVSITLVEGKASGTLLPTGTIFVSLSAQPLEDITVEIVTEYLNGSITISKVNEVQTLLSALSFSSSNWQDGYTLQINSVEDLDVLDGLLTVTLKVASLSTPNYSNADYGYLVASASYNVDDS